MMNLGPWKMKGYVRMGFGVDQPVPLYTPSVFRAGTSFSFGATDDDWCLVESGSILFRSSKNLLLMDVIVCGCIRCD